MPECATTQEQLRKAARRLDEGEAPPPRKYKTTPLSMQQLVPMTFVLLSESLCGSMLQPFAAAFVAFLQNRPREEAGYAVGVLTGMFCFGQVMSSRTWGWLSDQYGRRFPLISGLFTSGVIVLCFGLSTSVWMCAICRFLQGLFNGNVMVAKTMMADITDKTNQAKGFSFVSLCFGFGTLIGPAIGGLLYDPTRSGKMSWLGLDPNGIFASRPALLPCLVIFVYSIVGMAICTFFVQETNPKAKPLPSFLKMLYPCLWRPAKQFVLPPIQYIDDDVPALGTFKKGSKDENDDDARSVKDELQNLSITFPVGVLGTGSPVVLEDMRRFDCIMEELALEDIAEEADSTSDRQNREGSSVTDEREEASRWGNDTSSAHRRNRSPQPSASHADGQTEEDRTDVIVVDTNNAEAEPELKTFGYKQAFERPVTRYMLITYMFICAADTSAGEAFALYAIAQTAVGGLGYSVSQLSYVMLTNSAPCVAANLVFQKACSVYHNKMGLFRVGTSLAGLAVLILSLTSYIDGRFVQVVVMLICTSSRQFFCSWCYGLITMLTARAAPPGHVGAIMGINQSCGAFTRAITPLIADPLFAWSISGHHVPPFNHVLVFAIASLLFWTCWARSYAIRSDTDGKMQMTSELGEPGLFGRIKGWLGIKKKEPANSSPTIEAE